MNKLVKIFISPYNPVVASSDLESQVNSFLSNTPNINVLQVYYQVTPTASTVLVLYATTLSTSTI